MVVEGCIFWAGLRPKESQRRVFRAPYGSAAVATRSAMESKMAGGSLELARWNLEAELVMRALMNAESICENQAAGFAV